MAEQGPLQAPQADYLCTSYKVESAQNKEGGELDPCSQEADGAGRAGAMGAPSDLQLEGSAEVGTGAAATEDL